MQKKRAALVGFLLLITLYLIGPKPNTMITSNLPFVPANLEELDDWINDQEATFDLRKDNEARIVWADSTKMEPTEWALVYVHGFSASQGEGYPLHIETAQRYGMNLYLARLHGHGIVGDDGFKGLKAEDMAASMLEALAIGNRLGKKVVLVGTSTGGTLAMFAAATQAQYVDGLVMLSPLIDFYDKKTFLLDKPWGGWLASIIIGGDYRILDPFNDENIQKYWYEKYHIDGLVALKSLISQLAHPSVFKQVKTPTYLGYYYKNEMEQDNVVSVSAMLSMIPYLGVQEDQFRSDVFPEAGAHVIGSSYTSKSYVEVRNRMFAFFEEVLHISPIN